MQKGFLTILLVIPVIVFAAGELAVHNSLAKSMMSSANLISLQQALNERQYAVEHGFENAVRSSLSKTAGLNDETAAVVVCADVENWIAANNYSAEIGFVDTTKKTYDYDSALSDLYILRDSFSELVEQDYAGLAGSIFVGNCVKFLEVHNNTAAVGLNNYLNYNFTSPDLLGRAVAFRFSSSFRNAGFVFLIPEGTVIQ